MKLSDYRPQSEHILIKDHTDLRWPVIPEGMIILQDTREQYPLFVDPLPPGLCVINTALTDGDYTLKGFEDVFSIERKRISDFLSYIGKERKRTTIKMDRFSRMEWVGLVIECNEPDLLMGYHRSALTPEQIRAALVSFEVRYGIHIYYNENRRDVRRWVVDRCVKYYKIKREVG